MHGFHNEIDWFSVVALAPGAWVGGWLGARIVRKMSGGALLWVLRITLVALAVKMIWG